MNHIYKEKEKDSILKLKVLGFILITTILFLFPIFCYSQTKYQEIIPPSPNSSELGKYVEVPINYFTGIPNISIPLYNIEGKNLSLPISLNYYAGGIKVEQAATWVGLGWSTNSGGLVTRVVRGLPDERNYTDGFFSHGLFTSSLSYNLLLSDDVTANALGAYYVSQGQSEAEPDMFYFNFLNFSGQFFFDINKNIHLTAPSDIIISYVLENNNIIKFTITTPDGNKFIFDQVETSWSNLPYDLPFNSSWYLSQIITQTDNITFSYEDEEISEKKLNGQTQWVDENGITHVASRKTQVPVNSIKCKRLSRIDWTNGHLIFKAELEREDLGHMTNSTKFAKALTNLQIFNQNDKLIKEFNFNYSLFEKRDCSTDPNYIYLCNRLKLNSITEASNGILKPPYIFGYNETQLPSRNSYSQDYWGFFNGVTNSSLVPNLWAYPSDSQNPSYQSMYSIYQRSSYPGTAHYLNIGGDRSPVESFLKSGILKSIQYPTGGYLNLEYQPNTFYFDGQNRIGGGLRILKTELLTDLNAVAITKIYSYNEIDNQSKSSGSIFSLPQYAHRKISPNTPEDLSSLSGVLQGTFIDVNPLGGLGESQGSYIGYKNVTVSQQGNGKTEYIFDLPGTAEDIQDNCVSGECIYNRTLPQTTAGIYMCNPTAPFGSSTPFYYPGVYSLDQYPFAPNPNYEWNRGQVLFEKYYSQENLIDPIKTIQYEYQIKNFEKVPGIKVILLGYMTSSLPTLCYNFYVAINATPPISADFLTYKIGKYDNLSGWKVLKNTKEYLYDKLDHNKFTLSEQDFKFDSPQHHFLTEEISNRSDGDEVVVDYTYPKDVSLSAYQLPNCAQEMSEIEQGYNARVNYCTNLYSDPEARRNCILGWWTQYPGVCHDEDGNFLYSDCFSDCQTQTLPPTDGEASAVIDMTEKNMIDNPIQVVTTTNGNIVSAEYTKFLTQDNLTLPRTIYDIEISALPGSLLPPSQPYVTSDGMYVKSSSFNLQNERAYFDSYDNKGNILQFHKKNDLNTSYIWGYSNAYPIIKGENIDQNTLQIAVNSSLPSGFNSLEELLTYDYGIKDMTSTVQKNLWNTFCESLTGQSSLSKTMVTIYTYSPPIGMTSQTDPNSVTTYYEYDSFGRLRLIRDNDGNILKTYDYHYK